MNDTPTALLSATRECLAEHGLAGTTSRLITARAGANLAAITYHFGSKDRLVAAALVESLRGWLDPVLAVLRSDLEPIVRTTRAVQTLLTQFDASRDHAPLYLEAVAQAAHLPEVGEALAGLFGELEALLADQITAMLTAGELPRWVDPDGMAALLVSVGFGVVMHAEVAPDGPTVASMAGQFASLLLGVGEP